MPQFVRAVGAWLVLVTVVVGAWLLLQAAHLDEAAGAWLGLLAILIAAFAVVGYATRRGGSR